MITFKEFLEDFKEEIDEVLTPFDEERKNDDSDTITVNSVRDAVMEVMGAYLKNGKYDPMELLNLFHRICTLAMNREAEDYSLTVNDVEREAAHYLSSETESLSDITMEGEERSKRF